MARASGRGARGRSPSKYAGDDSRSGSSSSEDEDGSDVASDESINAPWEEEASSPGGSPEAANESVYQGDEGETLDDLMEHDE